MDLLSYVRSAVSKDKIRFRDGQYDLDLTYIKDNVIAMGFPASGVESAYRNDIGHVAEMLNGRHYMHYMIWNLSQRPYDYSLFHNMIQPLGWPDHHAPALSLLFKIVSGMDSWLKADKKNVAVVHCMAGKGRTGTVICSYLLFCGEFDDPLKAIRFFGRKRSAIEAGVEQPSQQRYVYYFDSVIKGFLPRPKTRRLKRMVLRPVPAFSHLSGVRPILHIFDTSNYPESLIYTNTPVPDIDIRHYAPYEGKVDFLFRVPITVKGDILIRLYHLSSRFGGSMTASVPVLRAQFHTAFIEGDVLVFKKEDLDLAYKDKRISQAFEMRLYFMPPDGEELEEDDADEHWTPEAHHNFMAVAKRNRERKLEEATRNEAGALVHKNNMEYQEEQFLAREATLGRDWKALGSTENDDDDDDNARNGDDNETEAAESDMSENEAEPSEGKRRRGSNRSKQAEADDNVDDDGFSIVPAEEGKKQAGAPQPQVVGVLDLSSAQSGRRNGEVVIGTRDSPRNQDQQQQQSSTEDDDTQTRRRSRSEGQTSEPVATSTVPVSPRRPAAGGGVELRRSTNALGNHRSSSPPPLLPPPAAVKPLDDGLDLSSDDVADALDDLLRVTEELKNNKLLHDDDDEDEDEGSKRRGPLNSESETETDDDDNDSSDGERAAELRGGLYIAGRDSHAHTWSAGGLRAQKQPQQQQGSSNNGGGTFGSLQEDLSDFEFLYTNGLASGSGSSSSSSSPMAKSPTGSTTTTTAPPASSSSSSSSSSPTVPNTSTPTSAKAAASGSRFPRPSSFRKFFLE